MSDEWHIYQAEGEMDLDLDELEAVAEAYGDGVDHAAEFSDTFDDQTVKALIARVRRAQRHPALGANDYIFREGDDMDGGVFGWHLAINAEEDELDTVLAKLREARETLGLILRDLEPGGGKSHPTCETCRSVWDWLLARHPDLFETEGNNEPD